MTDDVRKDDPEEPYEAPRIEDLESGPAVTAAGLTGTDDSQ